MNTNWMFRGLALALLLGGAVQADEATDKAMEALKKYEWGSDRAALQPIEAAIVATKADAAARKALETSLAEVLKGDAPQAAKDFVCRQLSLIGTPNPFPPWRHCFRMRSCPTWRAMPWNACRMTLPSRRCAMPFPRRRACAR